MCDRQLCHTAVHSYTPAWQFEVHHLLRRMPYGIASSTTATAMICIGTLLCCALLVPDSRRVACHKHYQYYCGDRWTLTQKPGWGLQRLSLC